MAGQEFSNHRGEISSWQQSVALSSGTHNDNATLETMLTMLPNSTRNGVSLTVQAIFMMKYSVATGK